MITQNRWHSISSMAEWSHLPQQELQNLWINIELCSQLLALEDRQTDMRNVSQLLKVSYLPTISKILNDLLDNDGIPGPSHLSSKWGSCTLCRGSANNRGLLLLSYQSHMRRALWSRTTPPQHKNLSASEMGKAFSPYLRSCTSVHLPINELPDPGLVFSCLIRSVKVPSWHHSTYLDAGLFHLVVHPSSSWS